MSLRSRLLAGMLWLAAGASGHTQVFISEFMAVNNTTVPDQDGQYSDWIEIYNSGTATVNLDGWYLTDDASDPTKWRFPSTDLPSGGYLVAFASGKDRALVGAELHTNFKLDGNGEYLALVMPDGATVASEYAPQFPAQQADVSYGVDEVSGAKLFLSSPTPGWANDLTGAGVANAPSFSIPGGVYTDASLSVALSADSPTAVIRYTLSGADPTETSAAYSGPIYFINSVVLRARVFDSGKLPSPIVSRTYIMLGSDVLTFNSNLPLVIINTFGRGIPEGTEIFASARFIDTRGGRSVITGPPDFDGRAGIAIRGTSSTQFPKKSYSFETRDETGDDLKVSILGLPEDSDWILYAPYTDKTMLRDVLAYELHGEMGHYSVRTRFVEVFVDTIGGRLTMPDYRGVYVFAEKIKRADDRVDIQPLLPTDDSEPQVTGGYIIKKDRLDPGDSGFTTSRGIQLAYVEPKEQEITFAQRNWLRGWLNQFESVLYGANFRNPTNGYAQFIDVDSFIDQHWIVEMSKNIDGFRLSNFMHKDRLGKLKVDPIWDWNLSWGNADYATGWLTNGWYASQVGDTEYPWFRRLFQDPDFYQRYVDRWGELRKEVFATPKLLARVDELAAYLNEAQARNYQKWRILGTYVWPNWYIGRTYQDEINWMKQWMQGRLAWIDRNYLSAPAFSRAGGSIPSGSSLSLSASFGTIYYTLTGEDPRLGGGAVNPRAQLYTSPVVLDANARVFARVRHTNAWSPPTLATFVVSTPPLVITEIMYHPAEPPPGSPYADQDFEFIELKNIGATTLNLDGIRFTDGIEFSFAGSMVTSLAPGQHVLVVKNRAAFESRYGQIGSVAGEFAGSLDNSGERLAVAGPLGEPILDFKYNDAWHPATDGFDFSLVGVNDRSSVDAGDKPSGWRASAAKGGSPRADDPSPAISPILINEILTHTDPPQLDSVELYNPNSFGVDVSHWYLTDQRSRPAIFHIPAGTVIPAGGYAVFTEAQFNASPGAAGSFLLDSQGEEIYLFSADPAGNLTGYSDGFDFGAAQNGVAFGRHILSTGEVQYPAQQVVTLGAANAGPRVGPVVINEMRYHPAFGEEEFVELRNNTDGAVKLYDAAQPENTWRLNGAGFTFPANTEIPGNGFVLLAGSDPAVFRAKYNVPANVPIFALYPGVLQNSGERLQLQRPDSPNVDTNTGAIVVPYIDVDVVRYNDKTPWPAVADGTGPSLERIGSSDYGNDPANWRAGYGPGTPGRDPWESMPSWRARYFTPAELADASASGDDADPDHDGRTNFEEYLSATNPRDAESFLKIESAEIVSSPPPTIQIRFAGAADRTYTVQYRASMTSGAWLNLTNVPPPFAEQTVDVSLVVPPGAPVRFYRLVTPRQLP